MANLEEEWDEQLPSDLWGVRTCINSVAFKLLYGRQDSLSMELILNKEWRDKYEKRRLAVKIYTTS